MVEIGSRDHTLLLMTRSERHNYNVHSMTKVTNTHAWKMAIFRAENAWKMAIFQGGICPEKVKRFLGKFFKCLVLLQQVIG